MPESFLKDQNFSTPRHRQCLKTFASAMSLMVLFSLGCQPSGDSSVAVRQRNQNPKPAVKAVESKSPITVVKKPIFKEAKAIENKPVEKQVLPVDEKVKGIDGPATPNQDRVSVKKVPVLERDGVTYSPGQVRKINTTLVLAYQPDIRTDFVIQVTRFLMDEAQVVAAKRIVREYDREFEILASRRHDYLEHLRTDEDVESVLLDIRMDVVDLITTIRRRVYREVLTDQQKQESQERMREGLSGP